ncbi:ABC transporter permease [Rhodoligotrophos ferricapiens]|uniref:ABC transporter permease n=1 Tax=Rhodoligotrophos ferricapiens TaxID=3069264 RepID=UPI00315DD6DA
MMFWRYAGRRLAQTVITLFLLLTIMFVMFRLIPGDPTTMLLGTGELPPEAQQQLRAAWGLDRPMWEQYLSYLANLARGDLGLSLYFRRPVMEVVLPMLGNTLILMAPILVIALAIGIWAGAYLGWHRGERVEQIGSLIALLPRALPIFWIAILLLMLFSYKLGWFPIGGMREQFFYPETWIQALPGYDLAMHLALPVIAGAIYFISDPLMITRTAMLEVRGEDYMQFARAQGLSNRRLRQVARRNAFLPVLTYIAIMVGFALGGQVLLEYVFSWPGMGRLMVNSVAQRDYPVAQATFFLMAAVVIILNFIVDLLYGWLDPRIAYD